MDDPAAVIAAIGSDLDREIVTYCTDLACGGSTVAVAHLEAHGYRNVRRYAEGKADWAVAGLPTQSAESNLSIPYTSFEGAALTGHNPPPDADRSMNSYPRIINSISQ